MNTVETQRVLKWVWVVLVVLAVFLAVLTIGALKSLKSVDPVYNSISVTGEGEAVSVPDVATFSFSVSADAAAVSDAQGEVTKKMDAILDGLKSMGIEENDIKTTDYSVYPKYTYQPTVCTNNYCPPTRQVPDGYTANHSVSVKVRKTENAGKALALVGDNGATGLSSIVFTVDDPDKMLNDARAEAIEKAKEKAEMLADQLGVRLGRVISFYDNYGGGPMPYYAEGMGGDMMKSVASPAPTIPIGENKTTVSVTITYQIR